MSVVGEEDDKSSNQQNRNDDGCEDCAFGHGLASSVMSVTMDIICFHRSRDILVHIAHELAGVSLSLLLISFVSRHEEFKLSASNVFLSASIIYR